MIDHDQDPDHDQDQPATLEKHLTAARRAGPEWNARRQQQVKWAIMARIDRRRPRLLFPLLSLGFVGVVALGVVGWRRLMPAPSGSLQPSELALLKLSDGSSIVLDGPSAVLKKTLETNDEVTFQLETGGAHFEVARRPSRIFRVHAGPVTVQVIGTRFHVRRQDRRSQIVVDRGKVLVSWWGGSRELSAGEQGTFPPESTSAASLAPAADVDPRANAVGVAPEIGPETGPHDRASTTAAPTNRADVSTPPPPSIRGHAPGAAAPPSPQALFVLADRARGRGQPQAAIVHLREIVERYPGDPHAPVAAFTLGRLLLESTRQPRQAAAAFEKARALAKGGPIAEDALAREVEALHTAGDPAAARERAQLYSRLFPNGPRLHTVMRFGGLRSAP